MSSVWKLLSFAASYMYVVLLWSCRFVLSLGVN